MRTAIHHVQITGISACVPAQIREFPESPETARITRSTGIKSVRIVRENQGAESLAHEAATGLLESLAIQPDTIDALIWVSQSPEIRMPYGATRLAYKLGLSTEAAVFDLASGCAGYIQGILQAGLLIQSGAAKRVLLLAAEANSRLIAPDDNSLAMLFGDAGTATLLEAGDNNMEVVLHQDGEGASVLCAGEDGLLTMQGMDVFQFSIQRVPALIETLCDAIQQSPLEIPLFALHQANAFILQYIAKKMGLKESQMPFMADGFGNTGPASIPLLLCTLAQNGRQLEQVIMAGFGIGLQWGGIALNLKETQLLPIKIS